MARRSVLSATERASLLVLPDTQDDLIRHYTFNESDWALIRQRRGDANRLGFAVQLCLLRYPGYALAANATVAEPVIHWIAGQIKTDPGVWRKYGERDETRREHLQELRGYLGLSAFGLSDFRFLVKTLTDLAMQTDKGVVLAAHALEALRQRKVILPTINVVERACAEAITRANRGIYRALAQPLTELHRQRLDELLKIKPDSNTTWLIWLRQSPLKPNSRYMLEHIERLKTFQAIALPDGIGRDIHQNRLLKIAREGGQMTPQDQQLINQAGMLLPRIKITELLMDVDDWTGFSRHFVHLKDREPAKDRTLLLSAILADAINLGLTKMAESCPGTTYAKLSWLQAWHIRDETYSAGLAELVNAQFNHAFTENWGDGSTSSSDGQRFRAGGKAESSGHVNPKYGSEPGRLFYTHISDQYAPFHTKVVNVGIRDSTYVLDGLLYHESDLRIEEHYTDTAGFTDHVFALMHLLGFRFAPRIRDLKDTKLYVPKNGQDYSALQSMIGGNLNIKSIQTHWDEILRLATSIKQGTVTASLMLRKLGSYPRQNGLAVALRELGRIERTLFILDWLQNVELRRRVHAGLNKGEARNALARAVFFNRLGEIRDRSFEQQRYRASGLNLVTAAIVLWNTVYLERAVEKLRELEKPIDDSLLQYLSPLGWEHINLTGDYIWRQSRKIEEGQLRPLRTIEKS